LGEAREEKERKCARKKGRNPTLLLFPIESLWVNVLNCTRRLKKGARREPEKTLNTQKDSKFPDRHRDGNHKVVKIIG